MKILLLSLAMLSSFCFATDDDCEDGYKLINDECQALIPAPTSAPVPLAFVVLIEIPILESSFSTLQIASSIATAATLGLITYVVYLGKQSLNRIGY